MAGEQRDAANNQPLILAAMFGQVARASPPSRLQTKLYLGAANDSACCERRATRLCTATRAASSGCTRKTRSLNFAIASASAITDEMRASERERMRF